MPAKTKRSSKPTTGTKKRRAPKSKKTTKCKSDVQPESYLQQTLRRKGISVPERERINLPQFEVRGASLSVAQRVDFVGKIVKAQGALVRVCQYAAPPTDAIDAYSFSEAICGPLRVALVALRNFEPMQQLAAVAALPSLLTSMHMLQDATAKLLDAIATDGSDGDAHRTPDENGQCGLERVVAPYTVQNFNKSAADICGAFGFETNIPHARAFGTDGDPPYTAPLRSELARAKHARGGQAGSHNPKEEDRKDDEGETGGDERSAGSTAFPNLEASPADRGVVDTASEKPKRRDVAAWKTLRLSLSSAGDVAELDGAQFGLKSADAATFLEALQQKEGLPITADALANSIGRPDRIYATLPSELQEIIAKPGRGQQGYRMM